MKKIHLPKRNRAVIRRLAANSSEWFGRKLIKTDKLIAKGAAKSDHEMMTYYKKVGRASSKF